MFKTIAFLTLLSVFNAVVAAPFGSTPCPLDAHYCDGVNGPNTTAYICHNATLGPSVFPNRPPVDRLFEYYVPLGGLCPLAWLNLYANRTHPGYVILPGGDGVQNNTGGVSISGTETLTVGTLIDRFGSESGDHFSPFGTPFGQRSLYPSSINTLHYYVYNVSRPFDVTTGVVAPFYEQPGQGVQYHTTSSASVLVSGRYLVRVPSLSVLS